MKVKDKLADIEKKILGACERSGRSRRDIQIIAVTKYVSIPRAEEAFEAGIMHLGENRDEELLNKYSVLKDKPVWHYIGSLQTRKVKSIIDIADYIHSLDRTSLAAEIQKRSSKPIRCLVQVNVSGEESKHGLKPEEVMPFIKELQMYDRIIVAGLMTMAPLTDDDVFIRSCFRKLKDLQDEIITEKFAHAPCLELSMGMSNDFEIAIEEGATMIRIGTALVGEDS
ncbi:hypothetical protein SAMN05443252_101654 [Bacillus sp. OV322]|uniref:YggS family pyridoxal phosphate-dependent enzyme n=1 Tax=Bacillus sp. OV322 TaxID=1882764 RepID=UPI0008EB128B|nr:YggS family pyridoxal phosphate-dependent enzyme [Bacillus sp. OV322]SFC05437.1 hypothetical protein SAMN05443252_101654 [Bacillus sp. OV322]